jgi:hypothetical protein
MARRTKKVGQGTRTKRAPKSLRDTAERVAPTRRILDPNATLVSRALQPLITAGKLRIPRGGYMLRCDRGRVIVERAD